MPITITTKGWITLHRDGAQISQHTVESKAIEAALEHAEANGDGEYELRFPNKVLRVSLLSKTAIPFRWSPITVSLTAGTATSVNVAQYLNNPEGRPVTFTAPGSLPTGATLSSAGLLTYDGNVAASSASVQFVATSGDYVAESNVTAVNVAPPPLQNTAPVFSVAPATVELGSNGGTIQFTAVDPQGDTVSYSLPTTRTGITINPSAGLVTVASSAAGTAGSILVRASDGSLTADHSCAVTVSASTALKWYPGHYAAPDAVLFSTSLSAHTTLWNQIGPVANFVGGEMYIPWGQLEPTTAGAYTWDVLDGQIAALAAAGKKAIFSVWAHRYGTTSTGGGYHPQYLIDSSDVVGGTVGGSSVSEACMWRSYVADRYMALFAAIAAKYDNDDRVAGVNTCETAFLNLSDYSGSALLTQWQRIAAYLPTVLVRTPVFIKANFLQTQDHMLSLMQSCVDAAAGMGGPDMFPIEFSGTSDNWGQRCLRGERYNGSTWVTGVAANQQPDIPVLMEQQVIRSTTATPAMYYNAAVTRYSCTHVTWQAKAAAKLYGGTTLIPAMNWLTGVLPYVRDNNLPLRTTIPTALA